MLAQLSLIPLVDIAAAYISHQLPGMLCIKRKQLQETILCHSLVSEDMAKCIIQLHYITGCDTNSSFYGKGKSSAQECCCTANTVECGNSLDVGEDIIDELIKFTHNVIYGDNKSSSMAEARAEKWKAIKKKSFLRIPPDTECLCQHFLCKLLNLFSAPPIVKIASFCHGWELVDGYCRIVRHTRPALPVHLPKLRLETAEKSEEDEHEETDEEQEEGREEDSEQLSEEEWSDLIIYMQYLI